MIRYAVTKDLECINRMLEEFNTIINLEELVNHPFERTLVIDDQKLVGMLNYSKIYDRIEINYIFIEQDYRRNGLAEKLFNEMINQNSNIKNVTLEVNENNFKATQFYKKLGFQEVALRKNYYNNENAILMIKECSNL